MLLCSTRHKRCQKIQPAFFLQRHQFMLPTACCIMLASVVLFGLFWSAEHVVYAQSNDVRISQFYGGGGNSGAQFNSDFVELFNAENSSVSVNGWSIQYASSSGSKWLVTSLGDLTIPAGGYLLIKQASGANGSDAGTPLAAPDVVGVVNLAASKGKVALVRSEAAVLGQSDPNVVDFVGYGAANQYEGSAAAPTLSNTRAGLRLSSGCVDTDENGDDFASQSPEPRNSSSQITPCTPPTSTSTPTDTPVPTGTPVPTDTETSTAIPTDTPVPTDTETPAAIPTDTPVPTDTETPTAVPTDTPVPTDTKVPTAVPTETPVSTDTETPTAIPTETPVPTDTETPTAIPTDTPVPTDTEAPTAIPTDTPVPTDTDMPTAVPTDTPIPTDTDMPTAVPTETPVPTDTEAPTAIPTDTPVPTDTETPTAIPTDTPVATNTETPVPTDTETPTVVPTDTETPTALPTDTPILPTITPTATPLPHLIISEILIDPHAVSDASGEWIELWNTENYPVDINGWFLSDPSGESHRIDNSVIIPSHGCLTLARNVDPNMNGGVSVVYEYSGLTFKNGDDAVMLLAPDNSEVSHIKWGDAVGLPAPKGASLEVVNANVPHEWVPAKAAWQGSAGDLGSPGTTCSAPVPTPTPTDILILPTATLIPPTDTTTPTDTATSTNTIAPIPLTDTPQPVATNTVMNTSTNTETTTAVPTDVLIPTDTFTPTTTEMPTVVPPSTSTITPTIMPTSTPANTPLPRLLVSELLADPRAVSDDDGEWIELWNIENYPVDIAGWILADLGSDRHVISGTLTIPPGGHVVLGRNANPNENGGAPVHYQYNSISLSNSADELFLSAPDGTVVDSVEWGESSGVVPSAGASIERVIDPAAATTTSVVWAAASAPWPGSAGDRGTPGTSYIEPTATPVVTPTPTVTPIMPTPMVTPTSSTMVIVNTSTPVTSTPVSFAPADVTVTLTISAVSTVLTVPTISVTAAGTNTSVGPATAVTWPNVWINEVMINPAAVADTAGEWIEICNGEESAVDLHGWFLADLSNDYFLIDTTLIIPANTSILLARNGEPSINGGVTPARLYDNISLANGADELLLFSPDGIARDTVEWGAEPTRAEQAKPTSGASIERIATASAGGWRVATSAWSGSAGDYGSPDGLCSGPMAATETPTSTGEVTSIGLETSNPLIQDAQPTIQSTLQPNIQPIDTPTVTIFVTPTATTTRPLPIPPTQVGTTKEHAEISVPHLSISEVMANPGAVADSDGEWFELHNSGSSALNLIGWSIQNQSGVGHKIEADFFIPAGGIAVFGRNDDTNSNGGVPVDYVYSGLTLPNSAGELRLVAPNDVQVDQVEWDSKTEPKIAAGKSIEQLGANSENSWATAWRAWPGSKGDFGSPGALASVQPATATPTATATETPKNTPTPTKTPTATKSPTPTKSPTATKTHTPTKSSTPTRVPTDSSTPRPTETPRPNGTPDPTRVQSTSASTPRPIAQTTDERPETQNAPPHTARYGSVLITEIMADPVAVSDGNGEWFELFNTTNEAINLRGWQIRDEGNERHTIGNDLIISAKEYITLARNGDRNRNGGVQAAYVFDGITLANGEDEVLLLAPDASEIDRTAWGAASEIVVSAGASIQRVDPYETESVGTIEASRASWQSSAAPWLGSAGDSGSPNQAAQNIQNAENIAKSDTVSTEASSTKTDSTKIALTKTVVETPDLPKIENTPMVSTVEVAEIEGEIENEINSAPTGISNRVVPNSQSTVAVVSTDNPPNHTFLPYVDVADPIKEQPLIKSKVEEINQPDLNRPAQSSLIGADINVPETPLLESARPKLLRLILLTLASILAALLSIFVLSKLYAYYAAVTQEDEE